jgi:hypothetical protein
MNGAIASISSDLSATSVRATEASLRHSSVRQDVDTVCVVFSVSFLRLE